MSPRQPSWATPLLMQVLESASEAVVLLDGQQQVVFMNTPARQLFGWPQRQHMGRAFSSLLATRSLPPLSPGPASSVAMELTDSTAPVGEQACIGLRADGTEFGMTCRVVRLGQPGAAGRGCNVSHAVYLRPSGLQPAMVDELQSVQRRLQALVDLAPIAIWLTEGDCVVFANQAAARLLAVPAAAGLTGRSVFAFLHKQEHPLLRERMDHALQHEGQLGHLHGRLLREDGSEREVEIALAALPDHGRTTVQMVVNDVTRRNAEMRELLRSRQQLKRLSANVVEAREEERRRIARELHDELGQGLSALKMEISSCARASPQAVAPQRLAAVLALLDGIVQAVRRIAADLRPLMLDDLGLADAIHALAQDFEQRHGLQVDVQVDRKMSPAARKALTDDRVSITLYRIVQEALNNVSRHARASHVRIELAHRARELVLSVADDGVGLQGQAPVHEHQFGLLGVSERAEALGGTFELQHQAAGGACLRVSLPLTARRGQVS